MTSRGPRRGFVVFALFVACCAPNRGGSQPALPPPVESTTLGPGDVFQLEIVGEKELPREYKVASDGTVDIPYIHRVIVEGLEPQEVQALVREKLMRSRILTNPSVVVSVREYASKRVTLLGEVQQPGKIPLTTGMTLLEAISMCGGFTAIAESDRVRITRTTGTETVTVVVNVEAIMDGSTRDFPLQAGDSIFVERRVF